MTERVQRRTKSTEIDPANEIISEQEAWESVFMALTRLARAKHRPVNAVSPAEIIQENGDENKEYLIRVNPALVTDKGQLEIIVVDVTRHGKPFRQWVAKAEWLKGKPKLIGLDPAMTYDENDSFPSYKAAFYAEKVVSFSEKTNKRESIRSSTVIYMSGDYSTRIH